MAHYIFHLFHSQDPRGLRVPISVTINQYIVQENQDGEPLWFLKLETNVSDENGNAIDPVYVQEIAEDQITEEISKATVIIADQVAWGDLKPDTSPPYVVSVNPQDRQENVSIFSNVSVGIRDAFPTTAIDPSTIKLKVNGIDVTPEIHLSGVDNEYTISWVPIRVLD